MFFSRNKTDLKKIYIYILIIHLGFKVKNSHFIKYSFFKVAFYYFK